MTCRHLPGDPNCSSSPEGQARIRAQDALYARKELEASKKALLARIEELEAELRSTTPDSTKYEILDFEAISSHLVMKVKYPSCSACSYEGIKIIVFLNTNVRDIVFWREIDPHFRSPVTKVKDKAPTPAARFPASKEGWEDALAYARGKQC